jgi:hypothetical protein
MTLDVTLRDTRTGFTGTYSDEYPDDYPIPVLVYLWTDGNYGCDCNRINFLYDDDRDLPCAHGADATVQVVRAVIRETGRVLCVDEKWDDE